MDRTVNRRARRFRLAAGVLAVGTAIALAGVEAAPAQDLHTQLHQAQAKLSNAKAREGVLSTTIQRYDTQLNQLEGEVASLRNQIAIARAQLRRVEAELARDRARLRVLRTRLHRALGVLSKRLVDIYKNGPPDVMSVLLNANGFNDVATRADYLRLIQKQDAHLAGTVRQLRNEARSTVHRVTRARDQIAARRAELRRNEQALAARQAQLAGARSRQQNALAQVKSSAEHLEGNVSAIQGKIAARIAAAQAAAVSSASPMAAGPVPGSTGTGKVSSEGLIWPVNGPITSPFCEPRPWEACHPGIDIGVPTGTPIHAAAAGTVLFTEPEASSGGYGNYTCIDHGNGLSTCYAHQERFAVTQGEHVSQGQVIGYTDCTGLCFGPHLHFEVRINGQVTDPMNYLP